MRMRACVVACVAGILTVTTEALAQDAPQPAKPAAEGTLPEVVVDTAAQPKKAAPKKKKTAKSKGTDQASGAPPSATAPTKATGDTTETAYGPVKGFVATRSAAGTKTDTPILETPQSISVITSDQMRTRAVKTVNEALEYTPGIYTHPGGKDPRFDQFTIRGFSAQGNGTFRDGLKELGSADNFTHFRNEPYGIERIDIMRGPASVLYGQTAPGGIIDIISKRPTEETLREVVGTIGTDERFQGAFDLSGAVDQDRTLLFRLVGLARDADAQVAHFSDFVEDDRLFLAPSFTWKPDGDTTLTVLTDFQHDLTGNAFAASRFYPTLPLSPAVTVTDAKPTRLFTGDPNYNRFEQDQFRLGYLFEHRFNDAFKVRQNLRYGEIDLDYRYLLGGIPADLPTVFRAPRAIDEHTRAFTVDNQIESKLATGAVKHTIVTGLDYQHFWLDDVSFGGPFSLPLDVNNPVYGLSIPKPTTVIASTQQKTSQTGIYAQDQAKLENWILTFGGRYDWAEVDNLNRLTAARTVKKDEAFSGRAGLTYLFGFGLAPYVSYAESFLPTSGTDALGDPFDPTTGQQYEAGVKYEMGKVLRVTLAAFDITQQNVLTLDTVHVDPNLYACAPFCQTQSGEVRSRGFEAEAVATLTQGLSLTASYTALDLEVTKTERSAELGKVPILMPEQLASIYADYTFQSGPLAGFGLGFGTRYIGRTYKDIANTVANDAYTVYDGGLHYTFDHTTLQLNASNLFGKEEATCSTTGGCQWISPRIVNAEVRYRW